MAQAPPRDHGHRHAARCHDGREHERDLVAHAASRVFVHLAAGQVAQVEHLAGVEHRARERGRLLGVQAADERGHQERRHLVVRHVAGGVGIHERADVVGVEALAVALGGDESDGGEGHGRRSVAAEVRSERGKLRWGVGVRVRTLPAS